jgi:hypothetical protein
MNLNQTTSFSSMRKRIAPDDEMPTFNDDLGGSSTIVEPEILNPVSVTEFAANSGGSVTNFEQVEAGLELPNDTGLNGEKEPSATTDENKTYLSGGTTPDSPIIIKKPKKNYIVYGIVGVIAVLVLYKLYFKKTN